MAGTSKSTLETTYRFLERDAVKDSHQHRVVERLRRVWLTEPDEVTQDAMRVESRVIASAVKLSDGTTEPEWARAEPLAEAELDYVERRFTEVVSPYLRLRYALALWNGGRRHRKYGMAMVDSSLALLRTYQALDKKHPADFWGLNYLQTLRLAFELSRKFKHQKEVVHALVLKSLRSYPASSTSRMIIRAGMAKLVLDGRMGCQAYELVRRVAQSYGRQLVNGDDEFNAIDHFYPSGRKADDLLGRRNNPLWDRLIADAYERMATRRSQEVFVALEFFWKAAEHHARAGNHKRATVLKQRHAAMKGERTFHESGHEIDIREDVEAAERLARQILGKDQFMYFHVLASGSWFVPSWSQITEAAARVAKQAPLATLFSTVVSDIRGNVSDTFAGGAGSNRLMQLHVMRFTLGIRARMLQAYLQVGAREGTFCPEEVVELISAKSWLSLRFNPDGRPNPRGMLCWAELVTPSVFALVREVQYFSGVVDRHRTDYVSAVDSLVLKFEGILRQYLVCHGYPTTKSARSRGHAPTQREIDINDLLEHSEIQRALGPDDLEYFRFVLVEHAGLNLRHNIAHALLPAVAYSWEHVCHLLNMLFRLLRLKVPYAAAGIGASDQSDELVHTAHDNEQPVTPAS